MFAVTSPCKLTAPVELPKFSCSVKVPMPVPILPVTVVVPVPEIKVTFSAGSPAIPVIEVTWRLPMPVSVSKVKSCPLVSVTLPSVIAVLVVLIVPAAVTGPAVAVKPPTKVSTSLVWLPKVVVPVFKKVVAVVMVFAAPVMLTL